eukprot:gene13784-4031_t
MDPCRASPSNCNVSQLTPWKAVQSTTRRWWIPVAPHQERKNRLREKYAQNKLEWVTWVEVCTVSADFAAQPQQKCDPSPYCLKWVGCLALPRSTKLHEAVQVLGVMIGFILFGFVLILVLGYFAGHMEKHRAADFLAIYAVTVTF